jgi:hypothetical protein
MFSGTAAEQSRKLIDRSKINLALSTRYLEKAIYLRALLYNLACPKGGEVPRANSEGHAKARSRS